MRRTYSSGDKRTGAASNQESIAVVVTVFRNVHRSKFTYSVPDLPFDTCCAFSTVTTAVEIRTLCIIASHMQQLQRACSWISALILCSSSPLV